MAELVLLGTERSHFTRKVRLLMDHLGLDYDMVDIGNVAEADQSLFGENPLMVVPVLRAAGCDLYDSDNIARWLVGRYDPDDRFCVLASTVDAMNLHAVMNGMMSAEVKLVLSARTGLEPAGVPYFEKAREVLAAGMTWLASRADAFTPAKPGWKEFHFISLWDHMTVCDLVLGNWPDLEALAETLRGHELIARSAPPGLEVHC
ncbi:MAG: glutathione S-transferase [Henriciella sp.]|uniref:glutathione S-transferase family protein n=1 Tax=Henriciella sp. TaxID=1968823 RepID=UPI0032EDB4CD